MVKHVVMWKFKEIGERNSKAQNLEIAKSKLMGLKDTIPQIQSISVGQNLNSDSSTYDLVLIADFNSKEDLDAYIENPEHAKVSAFLKKVKIGRICIDYNVD